METFIETLQELGALMVVMGLIICLGFIGYRCFKAGEKHRERLEKRAGTYDLTTQYEEKENKELESIRQRKKELGRG